MTKQTRLPWHMMELYIAERYPDPDITRHLHSTKQGAIVSSTWVHQLLDLPLAAVRRYRYEGCPYYAADAAACAIGVHPSRVWPDWYRVDPSPTQSIQLELL